MSASDDQSDGSGVGVPPYVLDDDSPAGLLTRLQRMVIFLEMLQLEAVEDFDISFRDFVVLATLRKEPDPYALPVSQLAEYVVRPMGSITHAIDRVERRGLVRREPVPGDRRKVIVSLTPKGVHFADEAVGAYAGVRDRVLSKLGDQRLAQIDESVRALLDLLQTDYEERQR